VSRSLAIAVAVVLFHAVLAGAEADLGVASLPACAALLLAATGLGLITGGGRPLFGEGILLTLLVPLRGPISDFAQWGLPRGGLADAGSALLSLGPLGFALGRQLRPARDGALPWLLGGIALGEIAVLGGATSWLPVWLVGGAAIAFLFALHELEPPDASRPVPPKTPIAERLAAGAVGAAIGLLIWALARVTPGYAPPGPGFPSFVALTLLAPAALIAWPASALARDGWPRRILALVGCAALAFAAARTLAHLDIYENSVAQVDMTMKRHSAALRVVNLLPDEMARDARLLPIDAWSWLVLFAGVLAATAGLALGARRGRELPWIVLGGAVAAAAPCLLAVWPLQTPAALVLVAASLAAAAGALDLLGWRGVFLLPLAVLPWLGWDDDGLQWRRLPAYDEMRRPGEYGIDAFARAPAADALLFLAPGRNSAALVGAQAHARSFTGRAPAFGFDANGEPLALFTAPPPPPPDTPPAGEPVPTRSRGLRVAGMALHPGHAPLGPEGSTGRMLRLFAQKGRAFVTGVGAELLAADLHDADLAEETIVASPVPLGAPLLGVLLEDCGSGGWLPARVEEPVAAARAAERGAFATVLVAPVPPGMPEALAQLTEERLARLAALLAPDGRCLAWVDTSGMSSAALSARFAAFGEAFDGRAAAFVEPRELDAPFVLLVGWVADAGQPKAEELAGKLPAPDATGWRAALATPADLSALLVCDAEGLRELQPGPTLARGRPITGSAFSVGGWAAVGPLVDPQARLSRVFAGAPDGPRPPRDLLLGLAEHASYEYRLEHLNETTLEIRPDIDWEAWEREVAHYERACKEQPDGPLQRLALAALLEPLVIEGDYGRFAQAFTRCNAAAMKSWRLALQEWWAQKGSLEEDAAEAAAQRAKELRGAR
jgi:hypothetical protein